MLDLTLPCLIAGGYTWCFTYALHGFPRYDSKHCGRSIYFSSPARYLEFSLLNPILFCLTLPWKISDAGFSRCIWPRVSRMLRWGAPATKGYQGIPRAWNRPESALNESINSVILHFCLDIYDILRSFHWSILPPLIWNSTPPARSMEVAYPRIQWATSSGCAAADM